MVVPRHPLKGVTGHYYTPYGATVQASSAPGSLGALVGALMGYMEDHGQPAIPGHPE